MASNQPPSVPFKPFFNVPAPGTAENQMLSPMDYCTVRVVVNTAMGAGLGGMFGLFMAGSASSYEISDRYDQMTCQ